MPQADIGLIGLAVMGQNLVLNMSDHGFHVAVFNRTDQTTRSFVENYSNNDNITACYSLQELVNAVKKPRCIMLMVKAGEAVDAMINALLPLLEADDIIIDGGNSNYHDSNRRYYELKEKQIRYVGMGVSGGEEGARFGPSIMPGGDIDAWPHIKPIFQAVAAKAGDEACCDWVGPAGSGHYVKMVHNGIEYGDMQLIAEAYDLLHRGLGLSAEEIHPIFTEWNRGVLDSYLIEITADIFLQRDSDNQPLIEKILDSAGQKGTGKWTVIDSLESGSPLTLIAEAVFARALSARKDERLAAQQFYHATTTTIDIHQETAIKAVHDALYASKIISYAQGFMLMQEAAAHYEWPLNYAAIAMMWRGGCIIRSRFLDNIRNAYTNDKDLRNLLLDDFFRQQIASHMDGWRNTVKMAIDTHIPVPAISSALAFFDGYCSGCLPANLIQAQRDYFGAHTYERVDRQRGERFHTDWVKLNGSAISGDYNA